MTLDDIAAKMRERFTPRQQGDVVTQVMITADEWNVLASAIYLRDAVQEAIDTGRVSEDKAKKAMARSRGEKVER